MRVLHGVTTEIQLPCSHGTPVLCDAGEEHWPMLSLFLAPTQLGRMKWVSWSFVCWGGDEAHVVGLVTKGFGQLALLAKLHMPEFWSWDEVHGEKKGYTAELVSQWFSPVALSKFDWQFSGDREGQTYSCFAFDFMPLWYFWGNVAAWLLPGNVFGKIQPYLLFKN